MLKITIGCILATFFICKIALAEPSADGTMVKPIVATQSSSSSTTSSGCSYHVSDTYASTEAVAPLYVHNTVPVSLSWTESDASPMTTPVPCDGYYQIFFSIQVQSRNADAQEIYVCVRTSDKSQVIYGCDETALIETPKNCGGYNCLTLPMTFFFAKKVYLTKGKVVGPPFVGVANIFQIALPVVTGGQFNIFYVGP